MGNTLPKYVTLCASLVRMTAPQAARCMGNTLPKYVSQTHVRTGWACPPDRELSLVTPATRLTCRLQGLG